MAAHALPALNPALKLAETLDRNLDAPTEVVVFGASALLLDPSFSVYMLDRKTDDIDIIVPETHEMKVEADHGFWRGVQKTNDELESEGLYISHIFGENQIPLTPEWQDHLVRLEIPTLTKLRLSRPRVLDLVISKMARGDDVDVEDVRRMLQSEHKRTGKIISAREIQAAAERTRVPGLLQEIFPEARRRIVTVAEEVERSLAIRPSRGIRP